MHCEHHATGAGLTAAQMKIATAAQTKIAETAMAGKIVEIVPSPPESVVLTRIKRGRVEITRKPAKEKEPA